MFTFKYPISNIMATIIEIANEQAALFVQSKDKKLAVRKIIHEISSLSYAETKEPVEFPLKASIVQLIFELVSGQREFTVVNGEKVTTTSKDGFLFSRKMQELLKKIATKVEQQKVYATSHEAYYFLPLAVH
ncbi:MAG: hypothetical protein ABI921_14705 [Panacibacter sp.]